MNVRDLIKQLLDCDLEHEVLVEVIGGMAEIEIVDPAENCSSRRVVSIKTASELRFSEGMRP